MDIIITIPKSISWQSWLKECKQAKKQNLRLYYRLGKRGLPKHTKTGEKCFVVHQGKIRGYNIISDLIYSEGFKCQTTGKYYKAGNFILRKGEFYSLENEIKMKGFQGFRYRKNIF